MILRHSMPNFMVWAPLVQVTASLMMNVGRVVTLPVLMPELLPNFVKPFPKLICGGTSCAATPAICGKSLTKSWFTEP